MENMIKLTFAGDVMCKPQMITEYALANDKNYNFDSIFEDVKDLINDSDFSFANLETPISLDDSDLSNEKYRFNSPIEFAKAVKNAGFDFVATANNHCLDRGISGISSTVNALKSVGLINTGVFASKDNIKPTIVDVKGCKIGIMSYTYGTNAFSNHEYLSFRDYWRVNLFQNQELSNPISRIIERRKGGRIYRIIHKIMSALKLPNANCMPYERKEFSLRCKFNLLKNIKKLKQQNPDLIVMYMHAGGQYNSKETKETIKLSNYLMNHGINVVVGSHEHVVHGSNISQIKNNKIATYSLGNFLGVSGVYQEPFDKMSEYSIVWHLYVDVSTKHINKSTYSIVKTVGEHGENFKVKTVPIDILYERLNDKDKIELFNEVKIIAKKFCNQDITSLEIKREYEFTWNRNIRR